MQKLKTYKTEAEVPTEHKAFYAPNAAGTWEPQFEGVESISGLVAKRDELLGKVSGHAGELSAKDGEISRLKSELSSTNVVPRGYRPVPAADAELLEKVKAHGTPEEVERRLTEFGPLSEKVAKQERQQRLDGLRKAFEWNEDAPDVLALIPNMPDTEDREVTRDGKTVKVPHAKIKDGDAFTFKPFDEFVAEAHPALMRSLKPAAQPGARVIGSTSAGAAPGNFFDSVREGVKAQEKEASQETIPLEKRLHTATA